MSLATTQRFGVYHLMPICHLHFKVGMEILASECLLPSFFKLLRTLFPSLVMIVMSELRIVWWVKSSLFVTSPNRHNGKWIITLRIFKVGILWRRAVSFTPWPPLPREISPLPIEQVVGWAAEPIWTLWRRENFVCEGNWTTTCHYYYYYYLISPLLLKRSREPHCITGA